MSANVPRVVKVVRIIVPTSTEEMVRCIGLDADGKLVIVQAPSVAQAAFFEVHEEGSQFRLSIPGHDLWVSRSERSLVVRGPAPDDAQNAHFYPDELYFGMVRIRIRLANESLYWSGREVGANLTLNDNPDGATYYRLDFAHLQTSGPIRRTNIGTSFWNDRGHSTLLDWALSNITKRGIKPTADFFNTREVLPAVRDGLHDADYMSPYAGSLWATDVLTYLNHFYAPDDPYPLQLSPYFRSALEECVKYSKECRQELERGDLKTAGYKAGLALHFITDLTQPMHAANFGNYYSRKWGLWTSDVDNRHTAFEEAADRAFMAHGVVQNYEINLERPVDSIERRVHACAVWSKRLFDKELKDRLTPVAPWPKWEDAWMKSFIFGMATEATRRTEEFLHLLIAKRETVPVEAPPLYIHSAASGDVLDVDNWGTNLIVFRKHDSTNQQWVVLDAMTEGSFYLCPMFRKTWAIGSAGGNSLQIVDRANENPHVLEFVIRRLGDAVTIGSGDSVLDIFQGGVKVGLYRRGDPPQSNQMWFFKNAAGTLVYV